MFESLQNFGYSVLPWVAMAFLYYINSNFEQIHNELRRLRLHNAKSLKLQELVVSTLCEVHDDGQTNSIADRVSREKAQGQNATGSARVLPFLPYSKNTAMRINYLKKDADKPLGS